MTEPPFQPGPNQEGSNNRPAFDEANGAEGRPHPEDGVGKTVNHADTPVGGGTVPPANYHYMAAKQGGETVFQGIGKGGTVPPDAKRYTTRWKPGDLILERYRVQNELGQGGMGVVYRCLDMFDKRGRTEVAVKALPPEVSHNPAEMDDMWENYGLVSGLIHENIAACKTLEKDKRTGDYYLVMEYVPGKDMRRWMNRMRREGNLTLATALPVLRQIARALDAAHEQRIMHRDVKPDNVRIKPDGSVKVLDFGLAAQIRSSLSRVSNEYSPRAGTNLYKAPEQWRGQPQGEATDQYALAVTAYEMLSGHVPFEDDNVDVLKKAVLEDEVVPIDGLPEYANEALRTGLAKEASDRYATCSDFVHALGGETVQRKTAGGGVSFDENQFFILSGRVDAYHDEYLKTTWDRGQTFGAHLQAFNDAYGAASSASKLQRLSKAYEFLLKAEAEWRWLQNSEPLRRKATAIQESVQNSRKQAEERQAKEYAKESWGEALQNHEDAMRHFEEGDFETALELFTTAASRFEMAGREALAEHVRQLEAGFANAMEREDFAACEAPMQGMAALSPERAEEMRKSMMDAKEAFIGRLKVSIQKDVAQRRFAEAGLSVQKLMSIDQDEGLMAETAWKQAKDDYCQELERLVVESVARNCFSDAESTVRTMAGIDQARADELDRTVQEKKQEILRELGESIETELRNGRFEVAHGKVREMAAVSEEEGRRWEGVVQISELEQGVSDAIAGNRFDEAERITVELSGLDEGKGRLKQEAVAAAKNKRAGQLEEMIAADMGQGNYASAYARVRDLAAINTEEGRLWEGRIHVRELEQTISEAIAQYRYDEAGKAVAELTSLDDAKGREWTEKSQAAKTERIRQLEASISEDIEKGRYEAARLTVGELSAIDADKRKLWEGKIHIRELEQAISEAIARHDYDEADKAMAELTALDEAQGREWAEKSQTAKAERIRQLEASISEDIEKDRYEAARSTLGELAAVDANEGGVWGRKIRVHELSKSVLDAVGQRHFDEADDAVRELSLLDAEAARKMAEDVQSAKNARIGELGRLVGETVARNRFEDCASLIEEIALLDAGKAQEWKDAVEKARAEAIARLETSIAKAIGRDDFALARTLARELSAFDSEKGRRQEAAIHVRELDKTISEAMGKEAFDEAEAAVAELAVLDAEKSREWEAKIKSVKDAILAEKDGHIRLLQQRVENLLEEKRFDEAEMAATELDELDSTKSAESRKLIAEKKESHCRQLEEMIDDSLTQARFDEAEEVIRKLATLDDSKAVRWKDSVRLRKLECSFDEALDGGRFDEALERIKEMTALDSAKSEQMKRRLSALQAEQAARLERQIGEMIGRGDFHEAESMLGALEKFDGEKARKLGKSLEKTKQDTVRKLVKNIRCAIGARTLDAAEDAVRKLSVYDSEKAQVWQEAIDAVKNDKAASDKAGRKNRGWLLAVAIAAVFVILPSGIVYRQHLMNISREAAVLAKASAVHEKNNAKEAQAELYAADALQTAMRILENAQKEFESGHYAEAKAGYAEAEKAFAETGRSAREGQAKQIVGGIDESIRKGDFSSADTELERLKTLDGQKAGELSSKLEDARKDDVLTRIARLESSIENAIKQNQFENIQTDINALRQLDAGKAAALQEKLETAKKDALRTRVAQLESRIEDDTRNLRIESAQASIDELSSLDNEKAITLQAKLVKAIKDAQIAGFLEEARTARDEERWQDAWDMAGYVLKLDETNTEAKNIKNIAEAGLLPKAEIIAVADGEQVSASLKYNGAEYMTPWTIQPLTKGEKLTGKLTCHHGGAEYTGDLEEVVNWTGLRQITVNMAKVPFNGTVTLPGGVELKLVNINAGSFMMGSPEDEDGRYSDELLHKVTLTKDYWLGQYEVTQGQYAAVMKTNPSYFKKGGDYPVEYVSWDDAMAFCKRLTEIEHNAGRLPAGYEYSLPTEAQWEYAARGGDQSKGYKYSGSDNLDEVGWYEDNSNKETHPDRYNSNKETHTVGKKKSNELGLYDMNGNVREWCRDSGNWASRVETDTYWDGVADPWCRVGYYRVNRGGSWSNSARNCRLSSRRCGAPTVRREDLGFRVALVPVESTASASSESPADNDRSVVQDETHTPASQDVQSSVESEKKTITLPGGVELKLVKIKAGSFMMGSPEEEGKYRKEQQHKVTLTKDYWLGQYEVTQAQYVAVMKTNPSTNKKGGDYPVEFWSWYDAMAFCKKLTEMEHDAGRLPAGYEYSLPTEAQWEYAARGGDQSKGYKYSGSDNLDEVGWYEDNSNRESHPVGKKKSNELGLYDMSGNVGECCRDLYGDYPNGAVTDPQGASFGSCRVKRGGSVFFGAWSCSVSCRMAYFHRCFGFRVALVPIQ